MNRAAMVLMVWAIGCASSGPPAELVAARAAYARAAGGPAPRVNPGMLQTAKAELDRAEASRESPEELRERAYIAVRRAEIADASAQATVAVEWRNRLDREIAELERARVEAPLMAAAASAPKRGTTAVSSQPTVTVERIAPSDLTTPEAPRTQPSERSPETSRGAPPASRGEALDRLARLGSVRNGPRGLEVTLPGTAMFVTGEARLAPEALASLENLAAAVKAAPGSEPVVLEVHTAGGASREAELLLSQQRAETIRSFLVARGVEPDRLIARGVGTDRPLATVPASPQGARAAATTSTAPAGQDRQQDRQQDRLEIILPSGAP